MANQKRQTEFLLLLDRCQGTIMRLCLVHTDRQPENVKDLYQDIVCNLWESYPRIRHKKNIRTWVYRVALYTAYMHHRSKKRTVSFIDFDDNLYETVAGDSGNEMIERLYSLIDKLDTEDRTLLFLYIDKVPQREIAKILDTTEANINQRITRLKKKLKIMNENEDEQ